MEDYVTRGWEKVGSMERRKIGSVMERLVS